MDLIGITFALKAEPAMTERQNTEFYKAIVYKMPWVMSWLTPNYV